VIIFESICFHTIFFLPSSASPAEETFRSYLALSPTYYTNKILFFAFH